MKTRSSLAPAPTGITPLACRTSPSTSHSSLTLPDFAWAAASVAWHSSQLRPRFVTEWLNWGAKAVLVTGFARHGHGTRLLHRHVGGPVTVHVSGRVAIHAAHPGADVHVRVAPGPVDRHDGGLAGVALQAHRLVSRGPTRVHGPASDFRLVHASHDVT